MRKLIHTPERPNGNGVALTHGAGGNADMPMLIALANALCAAGFLAVRYDLPFRMKRKTGPPAGNGSGDRAGIQEIGSWLRSQVPGRVLMGGQSYGGRQTTMAASEDPKMADGLLLFSYPLHPPGKPEQRRTAHFGTIQTHVLFVHGTKDPFGTIDELQEAMRIIPGQTRLSIVEGAGHDLKRGSFDVQKIVLQPLGGLIGGMG